MAVKREQIQPGVWIVQNLIKHQNDYVLLRVKEVGKTMTEFDKMVKFSTYSFGDRPMPAKFSESFQIPTSSIYTKSWFSLAKNAPKKYKRMIIEAVLKK